MLSNKLSCSIPVWNICVDFYLSVLLSITSSNWSKDNNFHIIYFLCWQGKINFFNVGIWVSIQFEIVLCLPSDFNFYADFSFSKSLFVCHYLQLTWPGQSLHHHLLILHALLDAIRKLGLLNLCIKWLKILANLFMGLS